MPDLLSSEVPLYSSEYPYHFVYDNIPLEALKRRDEILSSSLDRNTLVLIDAQGTQGSLSNRLNQSIDEDGNLKDTAIDEALHNIAEHSDGTKTVSDEDLDYYANTLNYLSLTNPVSFVRMMNVERDKLSRIADEATNLSVELNLPSQIILINDGSIELQNSDTIEWSFTAPNIIKPVINFSIDFVHRHYYDVEPVTVDYLNYSVNVLSTPYMEGSLRVYINGSRLTENSEIYVSGYTPESDNISIGFTSDYENGTFFLTNAITDDDIIRIDFDIALN